VGGEVHEADGHPVGGLQGGGREVEDAGDAGLAEQLGGLLGGGGRRGPFGVVQDRPFGRAQGRLFVAAVGGFQGALDFGDSGRGGGGLALFARISWMITTVYV
jgi:hypothetical protein